VKETNLPLHENEILFVHVTRTRYSLSYLVSYFRAVVNLFQTKCSYRMAFTLSRSVLTSPLIFLQNKSLKDIGSG
jgi:hypothetical protein